MIVSNFTPYQYNNNINFQHNRNKISFGRQSEFGKLLNEILNKGKASKKDRNILAQKLSQIFPNIAKPDNKLGEGFFSYVYNIDENFVLKIFKGYKPETFEMDPLPQNGFSALKTYFGDYVASFGEEMEILRNVSKSGKHLQAGVPDKYGQLNTMQDCIKYYEEIYLPIFSRVPQSEFDKIAKDLKTLNSMCRNYVFDYNNPNNFILAPGKKLRITDEIGSGKDINIKVNSIENLLNVYLAKINLYTYAVFNEKVLDLRRKLYTKIILAGMKYNLPITNSKDTFIKCWEFVTNELCQSNIPAAQVKKELQRIQEQFPNTQKRLKMTKQYLKFIYSD